MAFIQILCFVLLMVVSASTEGSDGICVKTWKSVQTVRQSYIHTWYYTYWGYCGWERCRKRELRSRIENRIKYEDVPHKFEYCCNGYEKESSDPLECKPRCIPKCILSNCTGPGICTCYPGHEPISNNECEPICDPNCVNAKCTDHNVCECKDKYKKVLNSTHICAPVCKEQCINGRCIAPDLCQCNDGYKSTDENKNHCLPHCDNCVNGKCIKPNVCECNEGYYQVNGICVPYCSRECIQGQCTAPNTCTCIDGYIKYESGDIPAVSMTRFDRHISRNLSDIWNLCIPYCSEPCLNADCTAPELCTCNENYTKIDNSTCKPICHHDCIFGECTAPETCTCLDGYKPMTEFICEPECENECINGYCSEPNNCTCYVGYERNKFDDSVCEPHCKDGCLNGNCTKPDVCVCDRDHLKVKNNLCMPFCNDCDNNFESCKYNPECVQTGKYFFTNSLHYTSNNIVMDLNEATMTLNWTCSDIFNNFNTDQCSSDDCETCPSLPLSCISEINFSDKHVDFVCSLYNPYMIINRTGENYTEDFNETDSYVNYTSEKFHYSITLIHGEELHYLHKGKCNVCMCKSNLRNIHKQNEAHFYFIPCREQNDVKSAMTKTFDDYLYIILAAILVLGTVLLIIIVYKIRMQSATYRVRMEESESQELTVDDEFLVNSGNIHEDD